MERYIRYGWMPPGNRLSTVERRALSDCLSVEYTEDDRDGEGVTSPSALRRWLTPGRCGIDESIPASHLKCFNSFNLWALPQVALNRRAGAGHIL